MAASYEAKCKHRSFANSNSIYYETKHVLVYIKNAR
uniref:Uncharacterized protein n=1 Tax=Anguilla anguilla TaxID=7936 RepID=A0A0E9XCC2_ANGAN